MPSTDTHTHLAIHSTLTALRNAAQPTGHCSLARHVVWRTHTHIAIHSTLTARSATLPSPPGTVPSALSSAPAQLTAYRHILPSYQHTEQLTDTCFADRHFSVDLKMAIVLFICHAPAAQPCSPALSPALRPMGPMLGRWPQLQSVQSFAHLKWGWSDHLKAIEPLSGSFHTYDFARACR